jgi:hypothetical protein
VPSYGLRSSSGSFAIFTAIRRASPLLSSFAAERRPGSSSKRTLASFCPGELHLAVASSVRKDCDK